MFNVYYLQNNSKDRRDSIYISITFNLFLTPEKFILSDLTKIQPSFPESISWNWSCFLQLVGLVLTWFNAYPWRICVKSVGPLPVQTAAMFAVRYL